MTDQYAHWQKAIESGTGVETERGNTRSGYYRYRNEAISFWRDGDRLLCWRSGDKFTPNREDEIDDLFGYCAAHPVSGDHWTFFISNGRWPEQLEPTASAPADLSPSETLASELNALKAQAADWLEQTGKIDTQEAADKAGNYAGVFSSLEKRATETHEKEKAPSLAEGRVVDKTWKPLIALAADYKKWAKGLAQPFLLAQDEKLKAERKALEAETKDDPTAFPLGPAPKAKAGTSGKVISLRSHDEPTIVDLRAFLSYLADQNQLPEDFMAELNKLARKLAKSGNLPKGVELKTVKGVA